MRTSVARYGTRKQGKSLAGRNPWKLGAKGPFDVPCAPGKKSTGRRVIVSIAHEGTQTRSCELVASSEKFRLRVRSRAYTFRNCRERLEFKLRRDQTEEEESWTLKGGEQNGTVIYVRS